MTLTARYVDHKVTVSKITANSSNHLQRRQNTKSSQWREQHNTGMLTVRMTNDDLVQERTLTKQGKIARNTKE